MYKIGGSTEEKVELQVEQKILGDLWAGAIEKEFKGKLEERVEKSAKVPQKNLRSALVENDNECLLLDFCRCT